jgi:hypothetical protein
VLIALDLVAAEAMLTDSRMSPLTVSSPPQ